jgi:drug/metabolite transporter (DMT)-like permease
LIEIFAYQTFTQIFILKDKMINWGIFILLSLIWGSSFKLMKIGMGALSAYQVAALRMITAGVVLLPFAVNAYKKIPSNKIGLVFLSGIFGNFFPAFLFCVAEIKIDSSLAGILNALTPLFTIVIGVLFFELKVSKNRLIGVIVGFIGLTLLFLAKGNITLTYISYAFLVLLATVFYGLNVNLIGRYLKEIGSLNIASLAFCMLIPPAIIILFATGFLKLNLIARPVLIAESASSILGIFGTAIASILFYVLVKRSGGLFASTVTYGIPFVAVFWGQLSGEKITLPQVVCLGIILIGVYLANKVETKNPVQRPG